ncbi:TPA: hypothetical protein ACKP0L_005667 [Pseudomonas putida]
MTDPKYVLTEPPAHLTPPLSIDVDGGLLKALNAYRQARHAWLACDPDNIAERRGLRALMDAAGVDLAMFTNAAVQLQLGEPDGWVNG